ncbi:C-type mannose receptor 2-like isoform X2 [Danio rerio]|uniref:C-type mannose receptor 2-like isoform X2 n=1 Tax=Danio rerio TaxID=7955 RepID=A0AC58JEN7_DANRE
MALYTLADPMNKLLHLLFWLSGYFPFAGGTLYGYVPIQKQMTWDQAQAYCRQNHIDLATVQRSEDLAYLLEAAHKMGAMAWIGLYNDINSWRWSYQNENITFSSWMPGEPNNNGHEECGVMSYSTWGDWSCATLFPFFCYSVNGTNKFVFVSNAVTWKEAQSYCRQHYTDLAVIRSATENNQLSAITINNAWIGLFRDVWKWSYSTNVSVAVLTWMSGQPDMTGTIRPCAVVYPSGVIDDQPCSTLSSFICMDHYKKHQIVRLKVKPTQNLNEPAVMEAVLQWVQLKLKGFGVEKDSSVSWNLQADGEGFHKDKP